MALFKRRIVLDDQLWQRAQAHVEEVGYSSVEEFVIHCIEKELDAPSAADQAQIEERLRGLGYLE
ncbi:MAG: hypothetical protein OXH81_08050 [Gemmatimonadetes bacterium]|nr:hypothetical protein [Gemmatimonadota bacterium]